MSKTAKLRCCASCMWVFRSTPKTDQTGCPRCGFGHYGARYALGDACYRAEYTQGPWLRRKLAAEQERLQDIIARNQPPKKVARWLR